MRKHACARGFWGHARPEKFFKLGALRSLLRPYLYSNLYLDSMPLVFLECRSPCSGIAEPSLHVFQRWFKRYQKGHRTRQFEGGALKGKSLSRGGHVPLVPPQVPPPTLRNIRKVSVRKTKLRQANVRAQAKVARARAWVCRGLATPLVRTTKRHKK